MTRDDHRAKCFEAICFAIDPDWKEMAKLDVSYGLAIQHKARRILDSIHGIAFVDPIEATEEMIRAGIGKVETNAWRAMSTRGNLTNPPEKK